MCKRRGQFGEDADPIAKMGRNRDRNRTVVFWLGVSPWVDLMQARRPAYPEKTAMGLWGRIAVWFLCLFVFSEDWRF